MTQLDAATVPSIASGAQPIPAVGLRSMGAVELAVARLDAWLDTMRCPGGYGGPVAHWWQQSFTYTGPALDWRYEGIIAGYLSLWERTGDELWLGKARLAGDDLVAGQLADGHYGMSAFELNPAPAGTPHEAACDTALLLLALALRRTRRPGWRAYAASAERNLRGYYLGRLWDAEAQSFRDDAGTPSFVPNKAATVCEALFLRAELADDERWIAQYALPTLDRIVDHQVRGHGTLDGAIAQNSFGSRRVENYFPIYIARCVPALLHGYRWTGDERYAESALRAMRFVFRWANADGWFPTAVYHNRKINRWPSWIAPLGDILRAAELLRPIGFAADTGAVLQRLLGGQDQSGGIQTANGFAAQAGGRPGGLPDVRDVLHVAGWCDKAFRFLAERVGPGLPTATPGAFEAECVMGRQRMHFQETPGLLIIRARHGTLLKWSKGGERPDVVAPLFWIR